MAEPSKAAGVKGALTKKYGPIPGYGWLAIAGVGAFILVRKRKGSSSEPDQADQADTEAAQPDYSPYQAGGGYSQQGGSGAGSGAPGVGGDQGGLGTGQTGGGSGTVGFPTTVGKLPSRDGRPAGLPPRTVNYGKGATSKHKQPPHRSKPTPKHGSTYKTGRGFAAPYKPPKKPVKHR